MTFAILTMCSACPLTSASDHRKREPRAPSNPRVRGICIYMDRNSQLDTRQSIQYAIDNGRSTLFVIALSFYDTTIVAALRQFGLQ